MEKNKPEITIRNFDPEAFKKLLMQDNVKIMGMGGLDDPDEEKPSPNSFRYKVVDGKVKKIW